MPENLFDLTGRVAVITGASRGLGRAYADALARAGMSLVVTSRKIESLAPVVKELEAHGVEVLPVALDVTKLDEIKAMVKAAVDKFGRIDALVNNAGLNVRGPIVEMTEEEYDRILDTNLKGAFFCAREVAPVMIKRKYGRIVNVGSCTSVFGMSGVAPYTASRAGALGMTRAMAAEWGEHGITVNLLAPGWFRTGQTAALCDDPEWVARTCERIPLGRIGGPGDLDGIIVYLCSPASGYMTGQILLVDGGLTTGAMKAGGK